MDPVQETQRSRGRSRARLSSRVRGYQPHHVCVCSTCGVDVYPFPLPLSPLLPLARGYPIVVVVTEAGTRHLHLQPRLLCGACVDPADARRCEDSIAAASQPALLTAIVHARGTADGGG